jgi:hypothetical protein
MSTIRLQALPRFPASVEAGDGIVVTRSNGVFTFAVDPDFVPVMTDFGRSLVNDANAAEARTTLGYSVSPMHYGAAANGVTDDTEAVLAAVATGANVDLLGRIHKITSKVTLASSQVLRNGVLVKGANMDMIDMSASYCRLENIKLLGVGTTYTGRGVIFTSALGGVQHLVGCEIYDTAGYCIEFTVAGAGNQARVTNCTLQRTIPTDYAVKLPASESGGNGLRVFLDCTGSGGALYDLSGGHGTQIIGGSSTGILWDAATDTAEVSFHRMAFAPTVQGTASTLFGNIVSGTITVQGNNQSIMYNTQQGGAIVIDAAATGYTVMTNDGVVTDNAGVGVVISPARIRLPSGTMTAASYTGSSLALGGALLSGTLSTQGTDANALIRSHQTDGASSTSGAAGSYYTSNGADLALLVNGTARTTTRYGITVGGYSEIVVSGGLGLLVGTTNNTPIVIGTNNTTRLTIAAATGLLRAHAYGAGALVTDASGNITANAITGTGDSVRATSPTLVTPALGVATATSINKVAITAPATSATLTIANGKTLSISNTLTFTGTDSSSVAFGAGGTVVYGTTGTFTPLITFTTPGNLSISYHTQAGSWVRNGDLVTVTFNIVTAGFTHTTASGDLTLTGLPFACFNTSTDRWRGTMQFSGITKAGYTNFTVGPSTGTTTAVFVGSGSNVAAATVTAADMPTGGAVVIQGSVTYRV